MPTFVKTAAASFPGRLNEPQLNQPLDNQPAAQNDKALQQTSWVCQQIKAQYASDLR